MTSSEIWRPTPERAASTRMAAFLRVASERAERPLGAYPDLHTWSVGDPAGFWALIWEFCAVVGSDPGEVLVPAEHPAGVRWFPSARMNYAENLLRCRDERPAIVYRDDADRRELVSWRDLYDRVAGLAPALRRHGCGVGTRTAALVANVPGTMVAMLAVTAIGGTWSSCSTDFGLHAVSTRFRQVDPEVLFVAAGLEEIAADLRRQLPSVRLLVFVPSAGDQTFSLVLADETESVVPATQSSDHVIRFERMPFDQPLFVLFSSGTTGPPKAIVHGAGGTLLQHLKEHQIHCDVRTGDRMLFQTTAGWMMWNWLASALASETTIVLFEGNPMRRSARILFDIIDEEDVTFFGTSAAFLGGLRKLQLRPRETHRLDRLRTIASTGSPLAADSFDHVYAHVKKDVHLASISGGTDIVSCFVLGSPIDPVRRGEIQVAGLGMRVRVFDRDGADIVGRPGELVCTNAFPSMPIGFLGDKHDARYREAYFQRFPGVWHHGDLAMITLAGGIVIFGRSDSVLNPRGIRIGTGEIYDCVERLPEVCEAIVADQEWKGDRRIVLGVVLTDGCLLSDVLASRIRRVLGLELSPHHVPRLIVQVHRVPRTRNGKKCELAVRHALAGLPIDNLDALENPEDLWLFRDLVAAASPTDPET